MAPERREPTVNADGIKAIIFDYGNTLVEFGEKQIRACDGALAGTLERLYGPLDGARLRAIRDRDRRAPYEGDFRENDLAAITTNLVRELYGRTPTPDELDALLRTRFDAFVAAVSAPPYLDGFLRGLHGPFRLALLSNYPDASAIRTTLKNLGLERHFDAVVISGEVGHVKPHPAPFRAVLRKLNAEPEEALHVGDNWLGDVQGAKRAGLRAAHIVQWDTPERFDPQPGDMQPDITIRHVTELLELL